MCSLCNHSISESFWVTARTVEFGEHLHGGQQMVTLLLKDLGVVRREDIRPKEVFQEDHSCYSALAKASALNISNSAETASRIGALQLMKGDALHDGSVVFNIVQQMEIAGTVTCEQEATQEKSFLQKKPLYTRELVKMTNFFRGYVKWSLFVICSLFTVCFWLRVDEIRHKLSKNKKLCSKLS